MCVLCPIALTVFYQRKLGLACVLLATGLPAVISFPARTLCRHSQTASGALYGANFPSFNVATQLCARHSQTASGALYGANLVSFNVATQLCARHSHTASGALYGANCPSVNLATQLPDRLWGPVRGYPPER